MEEGSASPGCEISIVIPCLNEVGTLAGCLERASRALSNHGLSGEIIVADNNSTDGSRDVALRWGARVVDVAKRGYGSAVAGGIRAAIGTYILLGDADGSYDFLEVPRFIDKLREGYDLVQGCRLPAGGGRLMPGAMPFLHRRWGNPMFSWLAQGLFGTSVHDVHCGLKAFTRSLFADIDLRCTGFEFNCELLLQATQRGARVTELPITLYRDSRRSHLPHLRTFRDGWRHLWFFLVYRLRWGRSRLSANASGTSFRRSSSYK
jgi:glycosyltransferase involved in cell wall biosynthesis